MTITITIDFECPRWLRRSVAVVGVPLLVLGASTTVLADVTVPYSFTSGQTVSAAQMNGNFEALRDGINNAVPVGTVISYFGDVTSSTPDGWLVADGSQIDAQVTPAYVKLVNHLRSLGLQYQGAAPTQAKLPDLRGRFLRGQDRGANVNPDAGQDKIGAFQDFATALPLNPFLTNNTGAHSHGYNHMVQNGNVNVNGGAPHDIHYGSGATDSSGNHSHTVTSGGDSETRPKNVTVVFLIRY